MKLLYLLLFLSNLIYSQQDFEINSALMNSTFKIEGSSTIGTVFILGKPMENDSTRAYYVLVTANHVLNAIKTDKAILYLRRKINDEYVKFPCPIQIRKDGKPLWTKHPRADVAAMYVSLPKEASITLLPTTFLATDSLLSSYELHPGDDLYCLGFPYGAEANSAGFPILRSGKIASYPLYPTSKYPTFLFDFQVFGGNSGGPVYFISSNRVFKGATHIGQIRFIVGLVSQQEEVNETVHSMNETQVIKHPLGLAVVIQANYIRETINLLPQLN